MLRFTVELVPHGDESRTEKLGSIEVWNTGAGTPLLASYGFRRYSADGRVLKTGFIGEFKRAQFGPWYLFHGVLTALRFDKLLAWRDGAPRSKLKGEDDVRQEDGG